MSPWDDLAGILDDDLDDEHHRDYPRGSWLRSRSRHGRSV